MTPRFHNHLTTMSYIDEIKWDEQGLVPAIAQDAASGKILMMAWMNRESLEESIATQRAVYWSRSRQALWRKGETSGHEQHIKAVKLDCDGDVVLLEIEQKGVACHTGRESCFFRTLNDGTWVENASVLIDPKEIYS